MHFSLFMINQNSLSNSSNSSLTFYLISFINQSQILFVCGEGDNETQIWSKWRYENQISMGILKGKEKRNQCLFKGKDYGLLCRQQLEEIGSHINTHNCCINSTKEEENGSNTRKLERFHESNGVINIINN